MSCGFGNGYGGAGRCMAVDMGGIGTNFALIVVLFILLIIVLSVL